MWVREKGNFDFLNLGFGGFKKCIFFQINQFSVFFHKRFQGLVIGLLRIGRFEKNDMF